jgi:ankyrin repeat protein
MAARITRSTGIAIVPPTWSGAIRSRRASFRFFSGALLIATTTSCAFSGPRPNEFDAPSPSPLHVAAGEGDLGRVRALLKDGADVNLETEEGTALHEAARGDHDAVAAALLEAGAEVDARRGEYAQTALFLAAAEGNLRVARVLVDDGADVNARTTLSEAPLHAAARARRNAVNTVGLLLDSGADVDAKGWHDWQPLYIASLLGRTDVAGVLIERGADVNARESLFMGSPLDVAASQGHVDLVLILIAAGADLEIRNSFGGTPLQSAALAEQEEVVALLLERGADVNARDASGATALHDAAAACREEALGKTAVAELLIKYGAIVDAESNDGLTPLDVAIQAGDEAMVEVLRAREGSRA